MTRERYYRQQALIALDDIGLGFSQGKPITPKNRNWLLIVTVNLFAASLFMTAVVAVSIIWALYA